MSPAPDRPRLPTPVLLELCRWNTPTIYNGWEQITGRNAAREGCNVEETRDFMPQMGPMCGYAVTLVIEPTNKVHKQGAAEKWSAYRRYIAQQPGPKIVVVEDRDRPKGQASFWGEVNANTHRALGCVGTITDGAIRDLTEMTNAGFKALARRLCVGHAHATPVQWGVPVEVFGRKVEPDQLIHADRHGFLVIDAADEQRLLEAAVYMDANECQTVISAARSSAGKSMEQILREMDEASARFGAAARQKFGKGGEW